jgi:hypothetical protein
MIQTGWAGVRERNELGTTRRFYRWAGCGAAALLALALLPGAARAQVVINEIMYNSVEQVDPDVEYVEIFNAGAATVNLTAWHLLDDDNLHVPCPLEGTLAPGEFLVIAEDLALFTAKYPGVPNLNPAAFGPAFGLANGSDVVRLFNAGGSVVDIVSYSDSAPWPPAADGDGPALELLNPGLNNSLAASWSANGVVDGTPGTVNSVFNLPIIAGTARDVPLPQSTDGVWVTSKVTDAQGVAGVSLFADTGSGFASLPMLDDGMHEDGAAGDTVYGAQIAPHPAGTLVRYYVRATDTAANAATDPPAAPAGYYAYTVDHVLPPLRIDEVAASNTATIQDPADGKFEDWLEIRNTGPFPVDLGGMFVSNDLGQSMEFALPAVVLPPGGLALVWCDNEPAQGPLHATFKLAKEGGAVALFDTLHHGNVRIGGFTFGLQNPNVSFGYVAGEPDAPEYLTPATPGASNAAADVYSDVCINEFHTTSSAGGVDDWVELHNRGDSLASIAGWHLTDDVQLPMKYTFPPGTFIPAGGYLAVDELELGFSFSSTGSEVIMLTQAGGVTGRDYYDYGPQIDDVSEGRIPDGTANWDFFYTPTQAAANTCAGVPPASLPPVELRLAGDTGIVWGAVDGAAHYDVVKGDLAAVVQSSGASGDFSRAGMSCVENNSADALSTDGSAPPSGGVIFYLARAFAGECAGASYASGGAAEAPGRDATIPPLCPP